MANIRNAPHKEVAHGQKLMIKINKEKKRLKTTLKKGTMDHWVGPYGPFHRPYSLLGNYAQSGPNLIALLHFLFSFLSIQLF